MALDLTKMPFFQQEDNGPFTDDMVRRIVDVRNTQHGIIKYMEAMAQVMAEAAIASRKATGDLEVCAIDKWTDVVKKRAQEIVREKYDETKRVGKGATLDQEKP